MDAQNRNPATLSALRLEENNYSNDRRVCGRDTPPILYLDDGTDMELPTTWGVCSVCDGEGKHINPSIDAGGISAEQFHEDPDFAEDYFSGVYDIQCNRCAGRTTERIVDWDALTKHQRELYQQQLDDEAADEAVRLAEIRMGA